MRKNTNLHPWNPIVVLYDDKFKDLLEKNKEYVKTARKHCSGFPADIINNPENIRCLSFPNVKISDPIRKTGSYLPTCSRIPLTAGKNKIPVRKSLLYFKSLLFVIRNINKMEKAISTKWNFCQLS